MEENVLLFAFDNDTVDFTLGFEMGTLWEKVKEGELLNKVPVHTPNEFMIRRLMDDFHCNYQWEDYDEEWSYLTILPSEVTS